MRTELRGPGVFFGKRSTERFERFDLVEPDSLERFDTSIRLLYDVYRAGVESSGPGF